MPTRQLLGRGRNAARQLAIGDHGTGEGHRPDEHTQEQLDPQYVDLYGCFLGNQCRESPQRIGITATGHILRHAANLKMRDQTDENRRQTHKAVHRGNQFRHLRHLHPCRKLITDGTATCDQDQRQQPEPRTGTDQRGRNSQRHTDNPVPYRAFGAFLAGQTAQRQDEKYRGNYIGRCCETKFHDPRSFKISGTWRACAVSRGSRQKC